MSTLAFAFLILAISVFNSCNPRVFSASVQPAVRAAEVKAEDATDYVFVYPGGVLPDSPFWYLKAFRDRVWLTVTTNPMKKAELSVLFADKRLMGAKKLFADNKPQLALSTLTKAEKYLENASAIEAKERKIGTDTKSFLMTLAKASLAHIGEMKKMLNLAPDDIKPGIVKAEDYAAEVYRQCQDALQSQGIVAPKNPFLGN